MSLFVCMECSAIENSNLVSKNVDTDINKPNMWLMDMQGCGNHVITTHLEVVNKVAFYNKDSVKEPEDRLMLCSECNTGVWHNEFDKDFATIEEKAMASFSKYNMITPYDHPEEILIKDYNAPHGYSLNYESRLLNTDFWLHYPELIKIKNITYSTRDFKETERGITIATGRSSSRSTNIMMAGILAMFGSDISAVISNIDTKREKTNNEPTIEDHKALYKADIKRQIKELKRNKSNPELLNKLQTEYREL